MFKKSRSKSHVFIWLFCPKFERTSKVKVSILCLCRMFIILIEFAIDHLPAVEPIPRRSWTDPVEAWYLSLQLIILIWFIVWLQRTLSLGLFCFYFVCLFIVYANSSPWKRHTLIRCKFRSNPTIRLSTKFLTCLFCGYYVNKFKWKACRGNKFHRDNFCSIDHYCCANRKKIEYFLQQLNFQRIFHLRMNDASRLVVLHFYYETSRNWVCSVGGW